MTGRPSEAQDLARTRNWGIRNLRALHALAGQLSPSRAGKVWEIIDEELAERGAETQYERTTRQMVADAMKED
jgi:hypothetical protein